MRVLRNFIAVFGLLLLAVPSSAQDADIENVIRQQIESFAKDDFESAFEFASPSIRTIFGSADRFGVMVKRGYPMVYRPRSFDFKELKEVNGVLFQKVLIEDSEGQFFELMYGMEETGKGWKINGVELFRSAIVGA